MDIKLYYQEKGTGEPLILLHGNGEDSSYFINQIDYFQNAYHVIALDTRGHGKLREVMHPLPLNNSPAIYTILCRGIKFQMR